MSIYCMINGNRQMSRSGRSEFREGKNANATATNQGVALIFAIFALMGISAIGISLARLSCVEMNTASNRANFTQATLASYAGIDYCLARLRQESHEKSFVTRDWECGDPPDAKMTELNMPSYLQGGTIKKAPLNPKNTDAPPTSPYTEYLDDGYPHRYLYYVCRVTDNSGKLNINDDNRTAVEKMLRVVMTSQGISDPDSQKRVIDGCGRQPRSMHELKIAIGNSDLFHKIAPYICIQSYQEKVYYPGASSLLSAHSININTATSPVLNALLTDLAGTTVEGLDVKFSVDEAKRLTERIIDAREKQGYFNNWEEFHLWLGKLADAHIFSREKISLVFAGICPLVFDNACNPDAYHCHEIVRKDLTACNLPATLSAGGVFTIESLGLLKFENHLLGECLQTTTLRIFSQFVHKTQADFNISKYRRQHDAINSNIYRKLTPAVTGPRPADDLEQIDPFGYTAQPAPDRSHSPRQEIRKSARYQARPPRLDGFYYPRPWPGQGIRLA